jgi:transcriptional regulator with XRE-family HTH domain
MILSLRNGGVIMELYERLKYLRKDVLNLSMNKFGEKIGVSRDVINNIEGNRLARPEQKLSLMKLIAKTFGVREEWLLYGDEPMFAEDANVFDLNELLKEEGVKEEDIDLVKAIIHLYIDLKPETRKEVIQNFRKYIKK